MMSNNSSRTWLTTALVVGAGALSAASVAGMAGVMSMQKANRSSHRQVVGMRKSGMMRGMMHGMGCMGEEMADEFCMMAHKTGNAMIRCGRFINKMVP